jgi:nitroimidazol reductase NimA-like FMN-containing flavoprotein (pyridoxamine 5'-phosphate oxidase superfamily)
LEDLNPKIRLYCKKYFLSEERGKKMFRPMRRFKQQMTDEECIRVLKEERRGVLSLHGEDGYPYGIPINYYYDEADGRIYLHGASSGHKLTL